MTDPGDRLRLFGQHDHVRLYGAGDFSARLEQAGFSVVRDGVGLQFGPRYIRRYGLLRDELLHIGVKQVDPDRGATAPARTEAIETN